MTDGAFEDLPRVIAHEAGHAVVAWASPTIPAPVAVRFWPLEGEAHVQLASMPTSKLPSVYLDFAAVYLGGFAGETVACGDFEKLLQGDFGNALEIAKLVRLLDRLPKRRRMTPFRTRLPWGLHAGMKQFLCEAFDLAIRRVETHRETFERVRGHLSRGYYVERRVEFLADELDAWLGSRPS